MKRVTPLDDFCPQRKIGTMIKHCTTLQVETGNNMGNGIGKVRLERHTSYFNIHRVISAG